MRHERGAPQLRETRFRDHSTKSVPVCGRTQPQGLHDAQESARTKKQKKKHPVISLGACDKNSATQPSGNRIPGCKHSTKSFITQGDPTAPQWLRNTLASARGQKIMHPVDARSFLATRTISTTQRSPGKSGCVQRAKPCGRLRKDTTVMVAPARQKDALYIILGSGTRKNIPYNIRSWSEAKMHSMVS